MAFDWEDYSKIARHLYRHPPNGLDESAYRAVISRAYYAAFCNCRDFAVNEGWTQPKKTNAHREVMKYFRSGKTLERMRIHTFLDRLRDMRNKADYDDTPNVSRMNAYLAILQAEAILSLLKKI